VGMVWSRAEHSPRFEIVPIKSIPGATGARHWVHARLRPDDELMLEGTNEWGAWVAYERHGLQHWAACQLGKSIRT
jgi:hypothetical protein